MAKPICQRCIKKHPATTTVSFSFSGSSYEIDLCEAQGDALYRDLFSWARLGRDVSSVERARRSEEERARTIAFPKARRVEVLDEQPKPKTTRTVLSTLPAKAEEWRLTTHAQERSAERKISREDVLWAAVEPTVDRPNPYGDGDEIRLRHRGTTVVVVNRYANVVLTVWDSATPKNEQQHEQQYAAAHTAA